MHVIHTIAGIRFDHGGTSRSVPSLCESLSQNGVNVSLVTGRSATTNVNSDCNIPSFGVQTHWVDEPRQTGRLLSGRRFQDCLQGVIHDSIGPVVVHDHGLWLPSNHAVAKCARKTGLSRIVTPRGMLAPWSMNNGWLKKKVIWNLFQRNDLDSATAFHATSAMEADDIRKLGFKQPIAILPNGVMFPTHDVAKTAHERPCMLFMSRIHRKKGLINLLRAWKLANTGDWQLVIAGPDEGNHQSELESEAVHLGIDNSVRFYGPVLDESKWHLFSQADLFVLPSFSENFGIVVAEALAAGLPVLTTTGTPWPQLAQKNIGWSVAPTVEGLVKGLTEAISHPRQELFEMGERASEWVRSEYRWDLVAKRTIEFYEWLHEVGAPPEFVRT